MTGGGPGQLFPARAIFGKERIMGQYVLTGAAGHVGSTVLGELLRRGDRVRALLLPGQKPPMDGAEYVYGDVRDAHSLEPLFAGMGGATVVHAAALISIADRVSDQVRAVNVGGTQNILDLCQRTGVRRLVHICSSHAVPEAPRGQAHVEIDNYDPDKVNGCYAKTKAEAARTVVAAARQGLDAVLVLPTGILGPGDKGGNHLLQMVIQYMQGKLPAYVKGGYDFVDVRDVARGVLLAAEKGRPGESYLLSGAYISLRNLLGRVKETARLKSLPELPIALGKVAVPFVELAARISGHRPLYTAYSLRVLGSNGLFSHEKATQELGYAPRPWQKTVDDTVSWLQENL